LPPGYQTHGSVRPPAGLVSVIWACNPNGLAVTHLHNLPFLSLTHDVHRMARIRALGTVAPRDPVRERVTVALP
jgi:hypothetical protein